MCEILISQSIRFSEIPKDPIIYGGAIIAYRYYSFLNMKLGFLVPFVIKNHIIHLVDT